MSAFDKDRYRSLIERCAFNAEFFRGTIQDLSPAQRAMSFVGAPTWGRINGWPCLRQNAAGDGTTSGVVAPVVDATLATTIETLFVSRVSGAPNVIRQINNGGYAMVWDGTNRRLYWELFDNVGALARYCYITIPVPAFSMPIHSTITLSAGGATGAAWLRGIPIAPVFGGVGVPAIGGNAVTTVLTNTGLSELLLMRVWQSTPTNEDVSALYQQARLLTGGEV